MNYYAGDDNDPYDPDMTVAEALEKGLIAVIDSGTIGRDYMGMCGIECRDWQPHRGNMPAMYCTRQIGHTGVHAYVARWNVDPRTDANHLEVAKLDAEANGHHVERVRHLSEALERVMKRVEELEQAEAAIKEVKRIQRLMQEQEKVREQDRQTAESVRKMTKGATQAHAVMDEFADAMKSMERSLDRAESLEPLRRKENKSWATIQAKSKRKTINPKGQRR